MKTLGIIQPGRIGDIILLLPAAKFLHDRGYKVFWPIFSEYVSMFSDVVDYVTFIPVSNNIYTCIKESYNSLKKINIDKIIDIAATFPDSICTEEYQKKGDGLGNIKFDEFKYNLLNVPINEKWNFKINRNTEKEEELYNQYIVSKEYAVVSLNYSGGRINVKFDSDSKQVVEINSKHNFFHWIKILENAQVIALVESSMSNLVEQLNLPNKKILFTKPDMRLPTLKGNWRIL